ncbi:MAG: glutamyl-tRNA reductase [Anaerolineae bacterium]
MHIVVSGVSHKTAPVEVLEKLAFTTQGREEALAELVREDQNRGNPVAEGALLFTCNRVELYALVDDSEEGSERVGFFLSDFHGFDRGAFADYLYLYRDEAAVSHLFAVASGIDSLVVGEPQILGQVRDAFEEAASQGTIGRVLSALFRQALATGKRARTETGISQNAVSVSYAAVELARKIFGDLGSRQVLIIGAGETGELTAKTLMDNGAKGIIVANRTYDRALTLARRWGGRAWNFNRLPLALWQTDIVISSTGAPHPILRPDMVREAMRMRNNRPLFLIDIAVPRDIDPAVGAIDNVYLYDIDDLRAVVEANLQERQKEVGKVEAIVAEEAAKFMTWFHSLDVVPTISDLRRRAESIRRAELEKALRRLGDLSERERNIINALTLGIVNKILHEPTVRLKRQANERDGYRYREAIRELFALDGGGPKEKG